MKVLVLVDPESIHPEDPQFENGHESTLTEVEYHVPEALRHLGHEVSVLPFDPNILTTIHEIKASAPQLIFNLTEHYSGNRQMDLHIVALLDMLHLPYTSTSPTGLMLCRHKGICKRILGHHRVKIPTFVTVPLGKARVTKRLRYPIIVKPVMEDGSDGISLSSLVHNEQELKERIIQVHERMKQATICEEFIEGQELYVGILGNKRLHVLPPREIAFDHHDVSGPIIATSKVKRDEAYRKKWKITYRHAELDPVLEKRVAKIGKRIYRLLQLKDYGRIDLRVTPEKEIYFLEANPNPDLSMGDKVAEAAEKAGIHYSQLIDRILRLAIKRKTLHKS
ncbi:MAG: ATP-grasp domain-containing protein [Kiritimatiellae bacterium]|nr:ATP-grasp domain-containing protein [Kiritimatiellia bacterium]